MADCPWYVSGAAVRRYMEIRRVPGVELAFDDASDELIGYAAATLGEVRGLERPQAEDHPDGRLRLPGPRSAAARPRRVHGAPVRGGQAPGGGCRADPRGRRWTMSTGCVRSADNICSAPLVCEICETCAEHCTVGQPGDLAAHCAFDEVIARSDAPPAELAEARAKAQIRKERGSH